MPRVRVSRGKNLYLCFLAAWPPCGTGCWQCCPARGIVAHAKAEPAQDAARLVAGGLTPGSGLLPGLLLLVLSRLP